MSNKSATDPKPNRRGRPAKSNSGNNQPDNGQTAVTTKSPAKPKLGYKLFFMNITDAIDAAMVATPDGDKMLYLRDSSGLWSKVNPDSGFFAVVSKSFARRNSGARLIGQFLYAEDVTLPFNRGKQTALEAKLGNLPAANETGELSDILTA